MTVDLVIFDCDGVLVESEARVATAVSQELSCLGLSLPLDQLRGLCPGRALSGVTAALGCALGTTLPPDFAGRCRRRLIDGYAEGLAVTKGLSGMLARLRPDFCVASASGPDRLAATLSAAGLDAVFGDRAFSATEVARPPPAPDLMLHAASRMGVAPARTLVVDDTPAGLIAALSAGMQAMFYAGAGHLAGADLSDWSDEVTVLRNWSDVPPALMAQAGPVPVH